MALGDVSMRVVDVVVPVDVPLVILHRGLKHTERRNGNKIEQEVDHVCFQ